MLCKPRSDKHKIYLLRNLMAKITALSSWNILFHRRTCLGCKTRIECSVAAPPCNTRKLSLPDISAVVAVALLSSFFAARPNSFSTFSTSGPKLNFVLIVVWSLIILTDTSPVLCRDANPYSVALAFGLLFDFVWKLKRQIYKTSFFHCIRLIEEFVKLLNICGFFLVTLFLLLLPELPFWIFVRFFVRLRFLLEVLLLDVRLLLALTLTSVEDSSAIGVIESFSIAAACVTNSAICVTFCNYES